MTAQDGACHAGDEELLGYPFTTFGVAVVYYRFLLPRSGFEECGNL